jgi:hypothetical protein
VIDLLRCVRDALTALLLQTKSPAYIPYSTHNRCHIESCAVLLASKGQVCLALGKSGSALKAISAGFHGSTAVAVSKPWRS